MNAQLIKTIATASAFLVLGLFILVDVLTTRGNSLANTYLYAAIGGFLLGLASPRNTIYPILILSVNVDLLKRLMVVYGYTSERDLYWIMGLAPLMLSGIVINLVLSHLTGKRTLPREHIVLFVAATVLCSLMTASQILAMGFGGRAIGGAINGGLYWYLIFVVPVLFKDAAERAKLLRFVWILFIPVACYMFVHYYFGLRQFEIDYLESGLSIEGRVLSQNTGILNGKDGGLRGFSTMSGASVVSTMLSTLILLVMTPIKDGVKNLSLKSLVLRLPLALLFMIAAYFTMTRKGWFCGVMAVAAYWAFRSWTTTLLAYAAGIFTFVSVVLASPAIVEYRLLDDLHMKLTQMVSPDSVTEQRALVLGTMYDRFRGWANMVEVPEMWQPFGFKWAGMESELSKDTATRMWGHDITVDLLIRLGYIPCFFIGVMGISGLYWLHLNICSMPQRSIERKISRLCLALGVGIAFGAFANANQLKAFPQNLYAFLFLGIVFATILEYRARMRRQIPVLEEPKVTRVPRLEAA